MRGPFLTLKFVSFNTFAQFIDRLRDRRNRRALIPEILSDSAPVERLPVEVDGVLLHIGRDLVHHSLHVRERLYSNR